MFINLNDKDKIKKRLMMISYYIALFEEFVKRWRDNTRYFYANGYVKDKCNDEFSFYKFNPKNKNAMNEHDIIPDEKARQKYNDEVLRTIKKSNKKLDEEASLFNWMKLNNLITDNDFSRLIELRNDRNEIVHQMVNYVISEPNINLDKDINDLIRIRNESSHNWFIYFDSDLIEPCEGTIITDEVRNCMDIYFDELLEIINE